MTIDNRVPWKDTRRHEPEKDFLERDIYETGHRISAVGSGISIRKAPRATANRIRDACLFYEKKCEGKHDPKTLATRYLLELSKEVQKSLDAIDVDMRERDQKVYFLETCMKEWESCFGPLHNLRGKIVEDISSKSLSSSQISNSSRTSQTAKQEPNIMNIVDIISPRRLKEMIDEYVEEISKLKREIALTKATTKLELRDMEKDYQDHKVINDNYLKSEVCRQEKLFHDRSKRMEEDFNSRLVEKQNHIANEVALREQVSRDLSTSKKKCASQKVQIENMTALNASLQTQLAESKALVDQNWNKLLGKAQDSVKHKYDARIKNLLQQIDTMKKQKEEIAATYELRLNQHIEQTVKPLQQKVKEYELSENNMHVENAYLRNRVKELNRIINTFQNAMTT